MLRNNKIYILKYTKIILVVVLICAITGCANRYYLKKRIDIFTPSSKEKFTIADYNHNEYSDIIIKKLKEKLENIPLQYSQGSYVPYLVYFSYKSRYFWFPMFRLTILKQSNKLGNQDKVLYDSIVYSYNTNKVKSLATSLKIVTDDLINVEYPTSKYIKVLTSDLNKDKKPNRSVQKKQNDIPARQHLRYKLYDNKELYKK